MSPELTQTEFDNALRRLLVLASTADEQIDPSEVQALQTIFRQLTGGELTESDLLDELSDLQSHPTELHEFVSRLAPRLDWDRKQTVLKAALLVAAADSDMQGEELTFVETIASSLAQDGDELTRLVRAVQYRPQAT